MAEIIAGSWRLSKGAIVVLSLNTHVAGSVGHLAAEAAGPAATVISLPPTAARVSPQAATSPRTWPMIL
jgi:hypothetical protein